MSEFKLTSTRLASGIWEARLEHAAGREDVAPSLSVSHHQQAIETVTVEPIAGAGGSWAVQVALPAEILNDGMQTVLIQDAETGDRLGSIAVSAGEPLDADLSAEISLLRAELDMLKRAFRRHCLETEQRH